MDIELAASGFSKQIEREIEAFESEFRQMREEEDGPEESETDEDKEDECKDLKEDNKKSEEKSTEKPQQEKFFLEII